MLLADDTAAQIALWRDIGLLRSSARREAEILVLRHQINVLRDRLLFVLSQLVPTTLEAINFQE
jgi:hypothetical protein